MKTKSQIKTTTSKAKRVIKSSKETLGDIFEDLLRDIYWAEKHLMLVLPRMANASFNDELKDAFNDHLEQTQYHVVRLERCFEIMEKKAVARKCEAMAGLIKEGEETIDNFNLGNARDAGLIAAAQKVEHYEISAYGTLQTMATVLGKGLCAQLLEQTKDEETEADVKLSKLAGKINQLACKLQEEEVE